MYNIKFPTDVSSVSVFAAVLCPSVYTLRSFSWIVSQVAIRPSTATGGAKRCFNFFHQRILSVDRMTSQIPPVVKLFSSRRKWSKQTKHTPWETLDRGIQCLLNFHHTPVEKAACILIFRCLQMGPPNSGFTTSPLIRHCFAKRLITKMESNSPPLSASFCISAFSTDQPTNYPSCSSSTHPTPPLKSFKNIHTGSF